MSYAYSVAIRLSVANLASQGIRLIAKDLLAAHGIATSLQTKMSALKLAAVGYGLDRAGMGIFHGLEKTVSAARDYTSQLSLMNAAGMSHAEIANSIGSAWSTSRQVLTSTATDNLRQLRELRSLFGDRHMNEAYAVLPTVARTSAMMEALTGQRNEKIGFEMAKVAELRQTGVMTLPFLKSNMDQLSRTLFAMGGTITTSDYLTTMKYAKTAALSLSDQFVYRELPTLIQEVKSAGGGMMGNASQAGTALMTLYSSIVQGKVPKAALPIWLQTGLVKPSDIVRNATGGWQVKPGGVEGAQLFEGDPFLWAQKVAPQLEGYAKAHHLSLIQVISNMFGARNAQWMMNTLIAKAPQIERDALLIGKTPNSYSIYQNLLKTNPLLAEQALHSQWQNVLSIIGYQVLPAMLPYMVSFAKDLNSFSEWMKDHPKLTEGLVVSLGALAGALTIAGKVMMPFALIKFLGLGPKLAGVFSGFNTSILTTVTTVSGALKTLGAAAAAFGAGYAIGTVIWKKALEGTQTGDTIGAGIAHILAAFGDKTAQEDLKWNEQSERHAFASLAAAQRAARGAPPEQSSPHIVTRTAPSTTVVHTQVNLDGKKLATVVTKHQVSALEAPQTGPSYFDGLQAPIPAGGF